MIDVMNMRTGVNFSTFVHPQKRCTAEEVSKVASQLGLLNKDVGITKELVGEDGIWTGLPELILRVFQARFGRTGDKC